MDSDLGISVAAFVYKVDVSVILLISAEKTFLLLFQTSMYTEPRVRS